VPVRALVTGAAGFLGTHFTRELYDRGYTVTRSDVRLGFDAGQIFADRLCVGAVFDLVVHCAAVEPHRAAIDGKPMHLAANLALDASMFDWAHRTGQKRVLYISSSAAYPTHYQQGHVGKYDTLPRPLREDCIVDPRDDRLSRGVPIPIWPDAGYGWLKLTGERMAADANAAGLPTHIVRPFSGYGEEQGENWPFGAFAARARRREDPFTIWGDGTQVRDWIHVSDVINGALAVVDQDVREPVNLCTGVGTSMAELVGLMCDEAGYAPDIELRTDRPAGVAYRVGDPTLFHRIYKPLVSLEEGVARAVAA
jgi:nucleoside-diphosphate-sugar epimerase